jgi:putative ABC transport system permease protein
MWRLVLGALRAQAGQAVVLFALAVVVTGAAAAAPLYARVAADELARTELAGARSAERAISAHGQVLLDANGDGGRSERIREPMRVAAEGTGLVDVLTLEAAAYLGQAPTTYTANLTSREGVCAHLTIDGACPTGSRELLLGRATATALQARAGDQVVVHTAGRAAPLDVPFTVVGVYQVTDPDEAYWAGRPDVTTDQRRTDTPMFTTGETMLALDTSGLNITVDLIAASGTLTGTPQRLRDVMAEVQRTLSPSFTLSSRLPALVERLEVNSRTLRLGIISAAAQLIVVCVFVLLLASGFAASQRRSQIALASVRGAPGRPRWSLALGPTMLVLAAAVPIGFALGWLAVRLAVAAGPSGQAPLRITTGDLVVAGVVAVAVMVATGFAELRVHAVPLAEALRRTPPRRRSWFLDPIDLLVTVLALGALYQVITGTAVGDLAALAPVLLALACGLLAGRLVMPIAVSAGSAALRRGRLGAGLAALHLARRAHAHRLLALVAVAVAMCGQTVAQWDATDQALRARAQLELGADRVLTVTGVGYGALRDAVQAADPDGRYAMAVVRDSTSTEAILAVQSERLGAVAGWPAASTPADIARWSALLRPAAQPSVMVTGSELLLDAELVSESSRPTPVRAHLLRPDGSALDVTFDVPPQLGVQTVRAPVSGCERGCRLGWFGFNLSPDQLRIHGLAQHGPDQTLLGADSLSSPGRWMPGFTTTPAELRIINGDGWMSAVYTAADPRKPASELRLMVADAPYPLPVVAAGDPEVAQTDEVTELPILSAPGRLVHVEEVAPGLPGSGAGGYLVDFAYAERIAGGSNASALTEVWLSARTPDSVRAALRATLTVHHEETVDSRTAALLQAGPGQSARLHLLTSVLCLLLAAAGIVVVATAERRERASELLALRVQGMAARPAAASGLLGYAGLVLGGLLVGALTAVPAWAAARVVHPVFVDGWTATAAPAGPRWWLALLALLVVGGLLVAVAVQVAGRLTAQVRRGAQQAGAPVATPARSHDDDNQLIGSAR